MNYRVERWVTGLRRRNGGIFTPPEIDALIFAVNVERNVPKKPRWRLRASQWRRYKNRIDCIKMAEKNLRQDRKTTPFLDLFMAKTVKTTHLYECPMAIQATCWCKPFMHEGLAFHRPWPGFLFWNFGEQGPTQTDRTAEGKP
jgi:hypothetical protein